MNSQHAERLEELQDYLTRIAYKLSYQFERGDQDPQDLLQVMNLYIVERAESDPKFLEQTTSYITKKAAWEARNHMRSDLKGVNHGWNRHSFSIDEADGDFTDNSELFAAEMPDAGIALDIRAALSALSETTQLVASLIVAGFKGDELAEKAGLNSKQAVSYHRRQIKMALAPVHAGR